MLKKRLERIFFKTFHQCPEENEPIGYVISGKIKNIFIRAFFAFFPISNIIYNSRYREKIWEKVCNERIVEIPFVFSNLDLSKGSKILDFGCRESLVSLQLASFGYEVVGVDLLDYEAKHPNFRFAKGDILKLGFPDEEFDCVIAISSVEHVGLGAYNDASFKEGDRKCVEEFYRILKPNRPFIFTVPFGKREDLDWERCYDRESLYELLADFFIIEYEEFSKGEGEYWTPCHESELNDSQVAGVALIRSRKGKS